MCIGTAYLAHENMKHFRDIALEDDKYHGVYSKYQEAALAIED